MTLPGLLIAAVISTLYGAAFHVWQGGGPRRLLLYLPASWVGFALGQAVGMLIGLRFLMIGPVNWGLATVGSALALLAAWWLARVEKKPEGPRRRPPIVRR